jgi:hypothetical protein
MFEEITVELHAFEFSFCNKVVVIAVDFTVAHGSGSVRDRYTQAGLSIARAQRTQQSFDQ